MTAWLSLLWMFLLVALAAWAVANVLVGVALPLLNNNNLSGQPRQVWLVLMLPWLLPAIAVLSVSLLATAKYAGWIDDHCQAHVQHHPHFCFVHLPDIAIGVSQSLPGISLMLVLMALVAGQVFSQRRQQGLATTLCRLSRGKGRLKQLPDSRPLAFTVGIQQPTVFLSQGLRQLLNKRQQRIVLAHECAHIRHHDVVKNTVIEILLGLHWWRQSLRQRWRLHTELAADARVAKQFPAWEIAEVLLRLKRAAVPSPYPLSIVGADIETRIGHLLNPRCAIYRWWFDTALVSALLSLPVIVTLNHHAVETWVGWLLF